MDSFETLEQDVSFDGPDAIASLVSLEFLLSLCTLSDSSKPEFAPSIKCHKLLC